MIALLFELVEENYSKHYLRDLLHYAINKIHLKRTNDLFCILYLAKYLIFPMHFVSNYYLSILVLNKYFVKIA